jgi:hypothetical protein
MVTDAEVEAACAKWFQERRWREHMSHEDADANFTRMRSALEAAEKARLPIHKLVMEVQNDPRVSQSASFHSPAPYVPQEPVTITRIVAGFPTPRNEGEE